MERTHPIASLLGMILLVVAAGSATRSVVETSGEWPGPGRPPTPSGIGIGVVGTLGALLVLRGSQRLREPSSLRSLRARVFELENAAPDPEDGSEDGLRAERDELAMALRQAHVDLSYLRDRIERSLSRREPSLVSRVRAMFRTTTPSPEIVSLAQGLDHPRPRPPERPPLPRAPRRPAQPPVRPLPRTEAPLWPPPDPDPALRALLKRAENQASRASREPPPRRFLRHLRVLRTDSPDSSTS